MTRAERRRAEVRQRITDAAQALLREQGTSGLRLSDVAERADVAFGSLYTYFENKDALLDAVVEASLNTLLARHEPAVYDDPAEEVAAATRRVMSVARDQRELALALLSLEKAQERFVSILGPGSQELLERGAAAGRFTLLSEPAAVAAYLLAGGFELIRGELDGRFSDDADVLCAEISLRALGLPPDEASEMARRADPE